jgi:Tfp pilus assembly protein PilN
VRAVNLIPADQRRGAGGLAGRSGGIVYVLTGTLGLLVVLGAVYALAVHKVAQSNSQLASLTDQVTAVNAQADTLQPYVAFAGVSHTAVSQVMALAESRFNWPGAMRQLALALPADVTFTAFSADASSPADPTTGTPATGSTFNLSGCAATQREIANVLTSLATVPGVSNVSLDSTVENKRMSKQLSPKADSKATESAGGACPYVTFTLGVSYAATYTLPNTPAPSGAQTVSKATGSTGVKTAASQGSTGATP